MVPSLSVNQNCNLSRIPRVILQQFRRPPRLKKGRNFFRSDRNPVKCAAPRIFFLSRRPNRRPTITAITDHLDKFPVETKWLKPREVKDNKEIIIEITVFVVGQFCFVVEEKRPWSNRLESEKIKRDSNPWSLTGSIVFQVLLLPLC